MKKIAILVDSICTLGSNGNPELDNVYILPLGLTTPDGKNVEDITSNISIETIVKSADEKKYYRTSTTKIGSFFDKIETLLKSYDLVIYLCLSSMLSSQYKTLKMMTDTEDDFKDRLWIFDTLAAGYSIEKMTRSILNKIENNEDITKEDVETIIAKENASCEEYIMCRNLCGVNEGGRIKKGFIKILDKLAIVPIIQFDKKNVLKTLVRNYEKGFKKICTYVNHRIEKTNEKISEVCFVYSDDNTKNNVEEFANQFSKLFNVNSNNIQFRKIMYPVLVHTLYDTVCFYFKFS